MALGLFAALTARQAIRHVFIANLIMPVMADAGTLTIQCCCSTTFTSEFFPDDIRVECAPTCECWQDMQLWLLPGRRLFDIFLPRLTFCVVNGPSGCCIYICVAAAFCQLAELSEPWYSIVVCCWGCGVLGCPLRLEAYKGSDWITLTVAQQKLKCSRELSFIFSKDCVCVVCKFVKVNSR